MRCCAGSRATAHRTSPLSTPIALDTPHWLMARWVRNYGAETARAIAAANGHEPALDLTVKDDPEHWASTLGGRVLPTGSVRAHGAWTGLAAAGLCRRRLVGAGRRGRAAGDAAGRCARARRRRSVRRAGRQDRPARRRRRPRHRGRPRARPARAAAAEPRPPRSSPAETVAADVTQWQAGPFDAVLLDAPCSSTGTIRRHPDIPWLKREADIAALAGTAAPAHCPGGRA